MISSPHFFLYPSSFSTPQTSFVELLVVTGFERSLNICIIHSNAYNEVSSEFQKRDGLGGVTG